MRNCFEQQRRELEFYEDYFTRLEPPEPDESEDDEYDQEP